MNLEKIKIGLLAEDPNNARLHSEKNLRAIKGSLAKFGQQKPIVVDSKNVVVAGNGTLRAAKELGWETINIVRTELDGYAATAYALADNRTAELAEWDKDELEAQLSLLGEELQEIAFFDDDFDFNSDDDDNTEELLVPEEDDESIYTQKVKAPVYEPKLDTPPPIEKLANYSKRDELIAKIKQTSIPKKDKDFLLAAATRHISFNYGQIAEYYAHAPSEVQELMEASALVIIDTHKAIENGFMELTRKIAGLYTESQASREG